MDSEGLKLKALCEGLELENLDNLLMIGSPEHYRAIGQEIAKAAKLGARRPSPDTSAIFNALAARTQLDLLHALILRIRDFDADDSEDDPGVIAGQALDIVESLRSQSHHQEKP